MDAVQNTVLAAGMAWGSGLRPYAVIFAAALLGRFTYLMLPSAQRVRWFKQGFDSGAPGTSDTFKAARP